MQVAREREAPARSEDSVRVDPICDVEFEGSMYRVVQLLDKVGTGSGGVRCIFIHPSLSACLVR